MTRLSHYRRNVTSRLPAPLDFALFVLRRLRDDRCLEAAGSLTFTTLLALVPFLTIALTVVSAFPMFDDFSSQVRIFLLKNLVPDSAGKVITGPMRQFTENTGKLTAVGMATLGVTALAMMATIDRAFNRIWRIRRQRPWLLKTLTYWGVLTLGPLLLGVGLTLTGWISGKAGVDSSFATLMQGSGFVLALLGFTLLYRVVPNCPVPQSHATIAAFFSTLSLTLMKGLFGLYVKKFATFKLVYGAFASLPIFLLWLYLIWVIVLAGAVLSASLSYWHGEAWRKRADPGQRLYDAVRLLLKLEEARGQDAVPSLGRLRRTLALGQDELHELLELLSQKGWVQSTRTDGWLLACPLEHIKLQALYHLLVARPVVPPRAADGLHVVLSERFDLIDLTLDVNLAELARLQYRKDAEHVAQDEALAPLG
ncbi:YihY family inner membrane protein [Chitinimonas sp. BJB300]|uniref:YihY family inner membrane protein n=1 Tax=Chitinimonas sp. BJB300 TaxID=1559339 RepID=UPI000C11188C|nr:YihY family inner membrane protein [Chitinimonas sp. BJB300]PHV11906.1 ribonuclease BN [Chitinimonas sp. BJB300]TSJ91484.1 YihY family inner membrane protein [Chitinimonas sp. BJB300]